MTKSRIMGIILIVLMVCLAFTGCKKDDRTVLRVLFYMDASTPNAVADANLWFSTFEKNNPTVKLERENLFDDAFHDKTRTYAAAGDLPDVLYVWPSGRSDYLHDQRLLKDLTPFINRDGIRNLYIPMCMDPSQQQSGYQAMIPQGITTTHAFFVNNKVLNDVGLQPAKTYAELVAQVPILKAAGKQTVLIPAESTWVMQSCLFSMITGRFGGADWHEKIHSGAMKFNGPEMTAAFAFVRQLYDDGVISREAVGVSYGDGPGMFARGEGAYYIDGDWRVGDFLTNQETGSDLFKGTGYSQDNIKLTVFPDIPGAKINKSSSVIVGVGYGMAASLPSGSEKERLSWELVKWMTGKEVSELRTERGGTPTPSRTDLNFAAMKLEPMQKSVGNLGSEFTAASAVIDGVFPSEVYEPINNILIELALGRVTGVQAGTTVQAAFDGWKK